VVGKEFLTLAMNIGEQMLVSGAEVNRVEDSITRLCRAYGATRVDVFTITSSIVVTAQFKGGSTVTQTRRIYNYRTDLDKLDKLNNLSRYICDQKPDLTYIKRELEKINESKTYSILVQHLSYALIAEAFTVFFGGQLVDAIVAALIGALLKWLISLIQKAKINIVFVNLLCSFVVGILAELSVKIGVGHDPEKIMIGNIMLLIPGIALTNSIRDIISGDTISGMLRLCEAIVLASFVAIGFGLASAFFGGI